MSSTKIEAFFSLKLGEDQKKGVFAENWSGFSPKLREELGLFRLIIQRSNLDGGALNLDGGTLTFDGGTRPPASPYNLNTA